MYACIAGAFTGSATSASRARTSRTRARQARRSTAAVVLAAALPEVFVIASPSAGRGRRKGCYDARVRGVETRLCARIALSSRDLQIERAHALEALRDVGPVHDLPVRLHPVRLHVLVLAVVGVLPHVEHEERHRAVPDVALVVVHLLDDEPLSERLPRERAPARALHGERGLGHLALHAVERAEVRLDGGGDLAVGLPAGLGREVLPEERVEDVSGDVEREVLLELVDGREFLLLARLGELLERLVRAGHVRCMMLVVMQLELLRRIVRLEGGVVVRKLRQLVLCHGRLTSSFDATPPGTWRKMGPSAS